MCRHLARLGEPRTLQEVVDAPRYSLMTQSWSPRLQRHGTVNVDGFGAGWYVEGRDEPVRYRRNQPIWTDASFASLAPTIASSCMVAALRSATPGFAHDESSAAPFTHGRYLFSHNGRLEDYPTARKALWAEASTTRDALAAVDSALLFGLAVASWESGASLPDGLVAAARAVLDHGGGRLTMLAADGVSVAGVVVGEPMHLLETDTGTVVASEPHDDGPWRELADLTVVHVTAYGTTETAL
ncbi:MAG: class II glutamine amidotransferase [Nocardioidaceae bacterium]|nr:class II glutamine amidotransferase [Nocardioidaceae bacterium]NUS51499.1 class II glutamine amidotransferase [Nocardioidaceae bacterium]